MTADVAIDVVVGAVRAYPLNAFTPNGKIFTGPLRLYGWSVYETSGAAAAQFALTTGAVDVAGIGMLAGGGSSQWFGPMGIYIPSDLSLLNVAGSWTGAVFIGLDRQ